jgi:hypothetical protein
VSPYPPRTRAMQATTKLSAAIIRAANEMRVALTDWAACNSVAVAVRNLILRSHASRYAFRCWVSRTSSSASHSWINARLSSPCIPIASSICSIALPFCRTGSVAARASTSPTERLGTRVILSPRYGSDAPDIKNPSVEPPARLVGKSQCLNIHIRMRIPTSQTHHGMPPSDLLFVLP